MPDGFITSTPESAFPGSSPELWAANPQLLDADGKVVMSLGALLVRTAAGRVTMVDLGWGPTSRVLGGEDETGGLEGGALLDNLAGLGVRPEDVDSVVFSHLHADHTGWIVDPADRTRRAFPNAEHYVSEAEWTYWKEEAPVGQGPGPTAEQLAALGQQVSFVEDGQSPVPGIDVVATPGHTPGHLSFVLSSGSERALVLGDAVHCPVEMEEPDLYFVTDVDPALAQRTRRHIEEELSKPGTVAAAPHFPDLVFGRLLQGKGHAMWQFPDSQVFSAAD